MKLDQFYHVVKAAAAIANVEYINVFGSNAILPWLKDELGIEDMKLFLEPSEVSRELDLSVGDGINDDLNTLIDGSIGESTYFDTTFNVYAHPNAIEGLFRAPASWSKRVKIIEVPPSGSVKVIVPHYLDLMVSKLVAGRSKDIAFAVQVSTHFKVGKQELSNMIEEYLAQYQEDAEKLEQHLSVYRRKLEGQGAPRSRRSSSTPNSP